MTRFKPTSSIADIRRGLKAAAQLDQQLCQEEWLRCYTYTSDWSPGVDLARFNNGSGDHIFVFLTQGKAVIKGFDHESAVSPHARDDGKIWPAMYDGMPPVFDECVRDPSVLPEEVTFCYWTTNPETGWKQGPVQFPKGEDDGAQGMLPYIPVSAEDYRQWAQEYYEMELEASEVECVFGAAQ